MKFESRKDTFFKIYTFGICGIFTGIILQRTLFENNGQYEFVWTDILLVATVVYLLWLYFGTEYELTETELKYKSGLLRGKIAIAQIHTLTLNKSLWTGKRPSTARKGIIVQYGKNDKIYITPQRSDLFMEKILKYNDEISIIQDPSTAYQEAKGEQETQK